MNNTISVIILNVNGVITPIKRWRLTEYIKKTKTQLYVVLKKSTLNINPDRLKVKG